MNRRRQREGKPPLDPLYSPQDVEEIVSRFRTVPYDKPISVAPGIEARWIEAGHLLGSASIQLTVEEHGRKKTVVFSGDLGQFGAPLTRYSSPIDKADAVFLESTYGDRNHRSFKETAAEFADIVRHASQQGGKILVPTFAVGRAQLLVVLLAWLFRKKEVKPFPIYLDSPMAIEASKIYLKHPELWHDRLKEIVREGPLRKELAATKSKTCVTAKESQALNDVRGTCMILAGAGMCNAGRILHHLRNNVWKEETSVVIVGYQGIARWDGRWLTERKPYESSARRLSFELRYTAWEDSAPTLAKAICSTGFLPWRIAGHACFLPTAKQVAAKHLRPLSSSASG